MCHNKVDELRNELLGCRLPDEKPDMLEGIGGPGDQDQQSDENGADRVGIPFHSGAKQGHHQTETVNNDVISVINEEHVDRRIAAEEETVGAEGAFGEDLGARSAHAMVVSGSLTYSQLQQR